MGLRREELGARGRKDAGLYPMEKGIMSERDWVRTSR